MASRNLRRPAWWLRARSWRRANAAQLSDLGYCAAFLVAAWLACAAVYVRG